MKKIILTTLAALSITAAVHAEVDIKLIVDDKIIDTAPISMNDRTLVPLRALMESTGAEVLWDEATMGIDITRNEEKVHVAIGNSVMNTTDGDVTLDAAPILYNDTTTYVPLRAICEAFDFKVDWDEGTQTVLINAPDGCPYVDVYDGMTVKDYMDSTGKTVADIEAEMSISSEKFDETTPLIEFFNAVPMSYVAGTHEITTEELREILAIPDETADDAEWGEVFGEVTLGNYLKYLFGEEEDEELFTFFKSYYSLGDEYTKDTKIKFVRTILDTFDKMATDSNQTPDESVFSEEQLAEYEAMLPELCKEKIHFTITLEDGSKMSGELYPNLAKNTVENFVELCNAKFYDGLIFHRVIDDFMVQGGGFDKEFNQKPANTIIGEFYANGIVNPLKHERGVISMARTNDPNSASSQFFIMDEAAPHLDGYYAAFGKITEGFDVLDKIAQSETETNEMGMGDVPVKDIVIKSITIK